MKYLFPFLIVFILTVSCQNEIRPRACSVKDPLNELDWLQELTRKIETEKSEHNQEVYCAFSVWQATLKGEVVFVYGGDGLGGNLDKIQSLGIIYECDYPQVVYNCQGDSLGLLGVLHVQDTTRIWSSK